LKLLSIVIPTYNRNEVLRRNLPILMRQLTSNVELMILDNASPRPVAQDIAVILSEYPYHPVQVVRHRVNLGASANILRSFEIANALWLWILGDDDVVTDTAVHDILETIAACPDSMFINFSTSTMRQQGLRLRSFDTRGLSEFVSRLDLTGNINFMSVGIWHAPSVLPNLRWAYHFAYSMSPTFALLLPSLGAMGRCHFSAIALVDTVTTADAATKWRFRDFIIGWNTILEFPMSRVERKALAKKMYSWHSPENVCVYFLADAAIRGEDGHFFNLAARRVGPYVSAFARLRFALYRPLFWSPQSSWPLVAAAVRLAVKFKLKGVDLSDIVDRAKH